MSEMMPAWEYRVESIGSSFSGYKEEQLADLLNAWGKEGWEVINVLTYHSTNKVTVVAKRPLAQSAWG